jgi:hypothetical protein
MNTFTVIAVALILLTGCAAKVKTNAEKCADAGGLYNAATRNCQMPSDMPKR